MKTENTATNTPVVCYPDRALFTTLALVLALLFIGLALSYHFPEKPPARPELLPYVDVFVGVLVVFCICFVVWIWNVSLRADESGLHFPTGRLSWSDIADFYYLPPTTNRNYSHVIIESQVEKKYRCTLFTKNQPQLQEIISAKATNAKTRVWGVKGGRPCDEWPRTLTYNNKPLRSKLLVIGTLLSVYMLSTMANVILKLPKMISEIGVGMTLAATGTYLLVLAGMPLMAYIGIFGVWREAQKRRDQQIVVSREGIVFVDGEKRIAALWDEVTDFYLTPLKRQIGYVKVIVTKQGTFDFTPALDPSGIVAAMVVASVPGKREWKLRDASENLVDAIVSSDSNVYHYRTRTNRAMLWLLTFFSVAAPLGVLLQTTLGATVNHPENAFWVSAVLALPIACLWWGYIRARIEVSPDGITQYAPFGVRSVRWEEVTTYPKETNPSETVILTVGNQTTRIYFFDTISDIDTLRAEIQQHVQSRISQ